MSAGACIQMEQHMVPASLVQSSTKEALLGACGPQTRTTGGPGMHHSKTGRIIAICASACLLFALGCGLLGLAVQQRVITLTDISMQLGPLSIITLGYPQFLFTNSATALIVTRPNSVKSIDLSSKKSHLYHA